MLTCERCHATFVPTKGVVEVTTLSVLCPTCLAEHQAAKAARRAGKVAAPAPAPAAPARPPAVPSRPPAVPARPPAVAARPPATPAPAVATATAPKAEPRGTAPAAARREARKPAARERGRKNAPREASQISTDLKKKGKREIVVAFTSAGLVMVLAGVVLWKVLAQKRAEAAEIQAQEERVEAFRSEFMGIDIQTEEGAQRLLVLAEEQKAQWTDADFASDVVNRTAKAKTYLEGLEEKRVLTQRLEEIEGVLARASEIAPSELAEQRRRLDELASKTQMLGAEFAARVAKDRA